jgi:hypothetical protein
MKALMGMKALLGMNAMRGTMRFFLFHCSLIVLTGAGLLSACSSGSSGSSGGGTIWATRTSTPVNYNTLLGVAASGSQAVAVGAAGTILTTSNGTSWTTQLLACNISPSMCPFNLHGIAGSATLFVAVGDLGIIFTATLIDITTWTQQTSGTVNRLRGVAWTGSQFIAVGDAGIILTSADGVTWSSQTVGVDDLYGVAASDSAHIAAVGAGSTILTSIDDGANWALDLSHIGDPSQILRGAAWSGNQVLIVGDFGTSATPAPTLQTSLLTTPWTPPIWTSPPPTPAVGNAMYGAVWSGKEFMAVGEDGSTQTSPDGVSWSYRGPPVSMDNLYGLTWLNKFFIAVGPGKIYTAPCQDSC